jgi:hypothetical protein
MKRQLLSIGAISVLFADRGGTHTSARVSLAPRPSHSGHADGEACAVPWGFVARESAPLAIYHLLG